MKTFIKALFIFGLVYFPCSALADSGKYADAIKLHEEFMTLASALASNMEKATSSEQVADALNQYSDKMAILQPKLMNAANKYPELKNQKTVPPEFKEIEQRAYKLSMDIAKAMQKAMQFKDPKVSEALKRVGMISSGRGDVTTEATK